MASVGRHINILVGLIRFAGLAGFDGLEVEEADNKHIDITFEINAYLPSSSRFIDRCLRCIDALSPVS